MPERRHLGVAMDRPVPGGRRMAVERELARRPYVDEVAVRQPAGLVEEPLAGGEAHEEKQDGVEAQRDADQAERPADGVGGAWRGGYR